jgi:hypothetical protein
VNERLLTYALRRKLTGMNLEGLGQTLLALISDAILAGIVAGLLSRFWDYQFGHATLVRKLGHVFVPGGIAALLYWLVALWLKVPAATEMTGLVLGKLRRLGKQGR